MKFNVICRKLGSTNEWTETYNKNITDPQDWAKKTMSNFNGNLRPHEQAREIVRVEILEDNNDSFHSWDKLTTGQSVLFRGDIVDLMRCSKCGVTGKRFGLNERIKLDSKFKGKAFERCDTAKAKIATNSDKYN